MAKYNTKRVPKVLCFMRANPNVTYTVGTIARVLGEPADVARHVLNNIFRNECDGMKLYRIGPGEFSQHEPKHTFTSRSKQIADYLREHGRASTEELMELTSCTSGTVQTLVQRMKKEGHINYNVKYYYILEEETADV